MRTTTKMQGNSAAVRIANSITEPTQLTAYQAVNVSALKGKAVSMHIAPINNRLDDLLALVTPNNIHDEESFGRSVGNEIL